jgi:hypothetical protein
MMRYVRTPSGRDEQIAEKDSHFRRTLSRFCSIAWFGHPMMAR